ncbi:MAG: hypothetical protein CVV57_04010 [Tenericutes bacterium HGW-Tenericutes-2]|jgi:tmRNA-binding protein|nr:MAG: hypothetical protein CVV57_04010 [Tenericutes bacterium HGW-Tenericutes-2]
MRKLLIISILLLTLSACKTTEPFVFSDAYFNYSIHSDFDLVIQDLPESIEVTSLKVNNVDLDLSNVIHDKNGLKLKSSYIKSLSVGEYLYNVITAQGSFVLNLNVIDTSRPYMISKSTIESDFTSNHTFTFELFGGEIKSVSGNNIKTSDYSISGNQLTIKKGFIENAYSNNESMESLILGYTLEVGTHTVIGYIFISKKINT